jgi:hypothetical protein
MRNSMSRWGGIPSNSYGKTSRDSQTTLILSRDVPLTWLSTLIWLADISAKLHGGTIFLGQTDSSLGTQDDSVILPQPIHAKNYIYALGVYDDEVWQEVYPLMAILIAGNICLAFISPPWELTIMVYIMMVMGRLCFATNLDVMKECDGPVSNRTIAGWEFVRNIPNTTSLDCWASSTITWLTFP